MISVISIDIHRPNIYDRAFLVFSTKLYYELFVFKEFFLSSNELVFFNTILTDTRKYSFLIGRLVAKKGIEEIVSKCNLCEIDISKGVFHQPVIIHELSNNIQVSISHSHKIGAAIVFPEAHPMAIDVELIDSSRPLYSILDLTDKEEQLIRECKLENAEILTLLWSAKEALSKVLKTGLMVNLKIYEIEGAEFNENFVEFLFSNFAQYKAVSWQYNGYAWSIVLPKKSIFNISSVLEYQHRKIGEY